MKAEVNSSIFKLEDTIWKVTDKRTFFSILDQEKDRLYKSFRTAYLNDEFSKLITLKVCNLFAGKYHFIHRHTKVASKPFQLMLDPSNNCQLQCPGCVHTSNPEIKNRFDWPGGLLNMETFHRFMKMYSPFAFGVCFYNYGEPLLNKHTPDMIRFAKRYLLYTALSSNMSIKKFDPDAYVRSGLDCIFVSLDGATQKTYATYRRQGDLDLCFENIRKLVDAKKRNNSKVPYIHWKYLTFEHNVHEIDLAIQIAKRLGVDEIQIGTPFQVDWDDPSIRTVKSQKAGHYKFFSRVNSNNLLNNCESLINNKDEIEELFRVSWSQRAESVGGLNEISRNESSTCEWLYQSITLDAAGRIHPCCMPPERSLHRVYGKFPQEEADPFMAQDMIASRLAFANREAFEQQHPNQSQSEVPFCAICKAGQKLPYSLANNIRRDLRLLDKKGLLATETVQKLTTWPLS